MGKRILKITDRLLPYFFGAGERHYRVVGDALPEDVRICNISLEFDRNCFAFLLESSEWGDVPEGDLIPEVRPRIQSLSLSIVEDDED